MSNQPQQIPASGVSPLLFVAALLAGAYATIAAVFAKNFDRTM